MNNIRQMKDLTSEKLTTDECLTPGLASMVMKVENPDLSNFRGEFTGDSLTDETEIDLMSGDFFLVDASFLLPMPR